MIDQASRFPLFEGALAQAREAVVGHHDTPARPTSARAVADPSATVGPDGDLPPEVEERLAQLETHASTLEMNAERLEDADNLAGAQHAREEAVKARGEFDALARAHGFDPYEDDPEEGAS